MLGTTMLNVVISLFLIYLLLALCTTIVLELLAGAFKARSRLLRGAIRRMLMDPKEEDLARAFYHHPLIKALWTGERPPSYIAPATFATVTLDILRAYGDPDGSKHHPGLAALARQSKGGEDFTKKVEAWFVEATSRVSGEYGRWSRLIGLGLGLALAVSLNVDTIALTRFLVNEPKIAAAIAGSADKVLSELESKKVELTLPDLLTKIDTFSLPTGWRCGATSSGSRDCVMQGMLNADTSQWLGWILTALAVSLGAQFWFDMLQKVVSLRSSVKLPTPTTPTTQGAAS